MSTVVKSSFRVMHLSSVTLLALLTVAPAVARAGSSEEGTAALARGVELRRKGDAEGALAELKKAYAFSPTGQAAAQLGLAHQSLGHWPEAAEKLEESLKAAAFEPWIRKNRAKLEEALAFVHDHVGTIEVAGSPAGATVLIEGRSIGALPLAGPAFAPTGAVAFEVRHPGYLPVVRNTIITAGQPSHETVNLRQMPPPEGPSPPAKEEAAARIAPSAVPPATPGQRAEPMQVTPSGNIGDRSGDGSGRVWAWTATGLGAAMAVTAVAATIERSTDNSELSGKLSSGACKQVGSDYSGPSAANCADLATAKDRWTYVAIGAGIGAVAAGAAAAVLFFSSSGQKETHPARTVGIVPSRAGATLRIGWTF